MPKRIQRKRTKGWRMGDAVYVGRGTQWGNPFVVGKTQVRMPAIDGSPWEYEGRLHKTSGQRHTFFHGNQGITWHFVENATAEQCVRLYAQLIGAEPPVGSNYRAFGWAIRQEVIRKHLAGKDLACWCPLSAPCHADVLLEIANGDPE